MITKRNIALAFAVLGILCNGVLNAVSIMPVGDSGTVGTDYYTSTAGGYRDPLYRTLTASGISVTYMGAANGNATATLSAAGQINHNGYGSYPIQGITDNLDGNIQPSNNGQPYGDSNQGGYWLTGGTTTRSAELPDIVLIEIGANDIINGYDPQTTNPTQAQFLTDLESRLQTLVTKFHTLSPNSIIMVAGIYPFNASLADGQNAKIQAYNTYIKNILVPSLPYTRFVDQFTSFLNSDGTTVNSLLLGTDNVHPTRFGYPVMALNWAKAIRAELNNNPATYTMTVQNGTVMTPTGPATSASFPAGTVVTISANAPTSGNQFAVWSPSSTTLSNPLWPIATYVMPAAATTITATYKPTTTTLIPDGTYQINSSYDGLSIATAGTSDGAQVQQQTYTGAATQQWSLTNLGNNTVKLLLSGTSEALEVPGGSTTSTYLDISSYTGATYQQWTLTPLVDRMEIVNVSTGMVVDVTGFSTQSGGRLDQARYSGNSNQFWGFFPVTSSGTTYTLTVNSGSGSGNYAAGTVVNVAANTPAGGYQFSAWTGSVSAVANPAAASTTLTMPSSAAAITASYTLVTTAPAAPTNLAAIAGAGQVSLSWTASAGATSYSIYRGTSAGGENATAIATGITATTYTDTGLTAGTAYYYKVTSVNAVGASGYSNEANATPTAVTYLIPNGTYEITAQNSGLAMAAGTTNGFAVTQQTYTGASTQQWNLNNLGSNIVTLMIPGTTEALEVPGASTSAGLALDVSAYTGGTHQQWTIVSVGSGFYEVVNVNSGYETNVAYNSTASGGYICQWFAGNVSNGVWSFTSASVVNPPTAPTNLTATAGTSQVGLSWTASTDATSYSIYRGTSAGGESTTAIATGITTTTYTDTSVNNGTAYYYKITAVNGGGASTLSNEAYATPTAPTGPPSAPTNVIVITGNNQVTLTWTACARATSYSIYCGTTPGCENATAIATGITSTSYTNNGLTNGTTYYYKVVAVNTSGSSDYSTESSGTSGTSLILAVGLERIVPGYNGAAIRIQRPSDGQQQDIGFASGSNALDMAAVSSFLGTSQGWIMKLYSQDGSGHDVTAPASTDNTPTIAVSARTSMTVSGTVYLAARNIELPYGPNGEGNFRYFILPSSVTIDRSQASVFLAYRPDYSGGPFMSLYEIGNLPAQNTPNAPAVAYGMDLMSCSSGFQGLTTTYTTTYTTATNSTAGASTSSQVFANNNVVARCQPTVVGLVTTPGSAPTLYLDGVAHPSGGSVPTSVICSGGYLMAGNSTSSYYGQALYGLYNFLGFAVYSGPVSASTAASISNAMLPRTTPSYNIVADGDSITQGTGSLYGWDTMRYLETLLNAPADFSNIAIYGTTSPTAVGHLTYPTAATSTVGLIYNPSYTKNIYYLAIGTNDIHGGFLNGTDTWNTQVKVALQDAKAMGFKTVVATILHEYNETTTASAEVNNFNALARAAVGQPYLDGLADYDADSRLQPPNYYPTYTNDGTHPNDLGYQVMSTIAAPVFNKIIGMATYTQWANTYFTSTDPAIVGPAAIPQKDGISNLLKYLFNINPSVPMSAADRAALPAVGMTTISGSSYITLTYRQYLGETGLTINVQTSTDMNTWTTVTPDHTVNVGTDPVTNDPLIQVQVKVSPTGAPQEFIRLNVVGS